VKPKVVIIGRPNVGKSSIFNKLTGKRISITADIPGVTRDRIYGEVEWLNKKFILIDTGGLEINPDDIIKQHISAQVQIAIRDADLILFVIDIQEGIVNLDIEIANFLRKLNKKIILIANKSDDFLRDKNKSYELYELGFGEPSLISAERSLGLGDLLDKIINNINAQDSQELEENIIRVAIVGRPNVGKSSLVNKILGDTRIIVSNIPGTTRDSIDVSITRDKKKYVLIDTAGIRRKNKVRKANQDLEYYSITRAVNSIERADICLLMLDATEIITEQDIKISGIAHKNGKPVIIAINKWDLINKTNKTFGEFLKIINQKLSYMPYAQKIFISVMTGQRLDKIFDLINYAWENTNKRIKTSELNQVITNAIKNNPLVSYKKKQTKIFYATQAEVCPPGFVFFVNNNKLIHFSYKRYLENQIRNAFDFSGTPVKIIIKNKNQ